jgi:DNA-binding NtrC family response regulator
MRILVIDDEEGVRKGLTAFFALREIEAEGAADYESGLALARSGRFDAALLDVRLGERDGLALLSEIMEADPEFPVIMISGHADIRTALEAIRAGAADFMEKPVDQGRLEAAVSSLSQKLLLKRKVRGLEEAWLSEHVAGRNSRPMREALSVARKSSASRLSVLIKGSSGSGKELFARYIHLCSPRSAAPLVTVNCAAVPHELFESELFGHKRGSFTGAAKDHPGFFRSADGGTLFLDEVGELPLSLQPKLLRALEYGEIQEVGSSISRKVDVRLIAATNRDLEAASVSGAFREDLYFRLAQVTIRVPDLSERGDDVAELAEHFLRKAASGPAAASRTATGPADARPEERAFTEEAIAYLARREYRGNVRELRNLIERASFLIDSRRIDAADLEGLDRGSAAGRAPAAPPREAGAPDAVGAAMRGMAGLTLKEARAEFDRRYIASALERAEGSVSRAAAELGILPNNLSREIKNLGLKRK